MKVLEPDVRAFRAATADVYKKFEKRLGQGVLRARPRREVARRRVPGSLDPGGIEPGARRRDGGRARLAMLAQVFMRYVFGAPFAWAEEFAVLVFAWLIFLGAAHVQRDDSHLSIDTLRQFAGPRRGRALDAFAARRYRGLLAGPHLAGRRALGADAAARVPGDGRFARVALPSAPVCFAIGARSTCASPVCRNAATQPARAMTMADCSSSGWWSCSR